MPELAEVETLKRYMEKHALFEKVREVEVRRAALRYPISIPKLQNDTNSAVIISANRIAKFLTLELDNSNSIIFHLGMSGRLTIKPEDYTSEKHDHVIFKLYSGKNLVFNDPRRFGMIYCCKSSDLRGQVFLKNMGQEPLEDNFSTNYLTSKLLNKKASIKSAIMDSRIVVGIGNIYAAESLFKAKIHPERIACSLSYKEVESLVVSIKEVLTKAINAGGTSLKDFVNGDNKPGYFQQELNVYGRLGKECFVCNSSVRQTKQAGRATYFCPSCQL